LIQNLCCYASSLTRAPNDSY